MQRTGWIERRRVDVSVSVSADNEEGDALLDGGCRVLTSGGENRELGGWCRWVSERKTSVLACSAYQWL